MQRLFQPSVHHQDIDSTPNRIRRHVALERPLWGEARRARGRIPPNIAEVQAEPTRSPLGFGMARCGSVPWLHTSKLRWALARKCAPVCGPDACGRSPSWMLPSCTPWARTVACELLTGTRRVRRKHREQLSEASPPNGFPVSPPAGSRAKRACPHGRLHRETVRRLGVSQSWQHDRPLAFPHSQGLSWPTAFLSSSWKVVRQLQDPIGTPTQ